MKNKIGERIYRIRRSKGLSQAHVAEDLGITSGAYAKIERGETDASASRLLSIAEILEVTIHDFFEDNATGKFMDDKRPYGFATKEDVEVLARNMQMIMKEIEKLKEELVEKKAVKRKAKK